jgi:NADPH2:quinone reductase
MLGARVLAVASTAKKRALAQEAGAEASLDPASGDLKQAVREWSDGGVDVAFDPVGGDLTEQALRSLGVGGRLLVIGFASGKIATLPANQVLLRNRSIVGVDWGAWALAHDAAQRQLLDELLDHVAAGRLDPIAPTTYPLARAADALSDLLGRRVAGKVALVADRAAD